MTDNKEPTPQDSRFWAFIYLGVAVNAVAMMILLWLFSRAFS